MPSTQQVLYIIAINAILYALLWRVFTLAGLRGWYALIPGWVFYCWARIACMKHPINTALFISIMFYGASFTMPWFSRVFGTSIDNLQIIQAQTQPTIMVSKIEFFAFGLFLVSMIAGVFSYIRTCWRLAESFSFGIWLAFILMIFPPFTLIIGLAIIAISKRPYKPLDIPR